MRDPFRMMCDTMTQTTGINENRVLTPKMNEMRLQGLFLRVSKDLLGGTLLGNGTNFTTSDLIHTSEIRNIENNAAFYFLRHNDATYVLSIDFPENG